MSNKDDKIKLRIPSRTFWIKNLDQKVKRNFSELSVVLSEVKESVSEFSENSPWNQRIRPIAINNYESNRKVMLRSFKSRGLLSTTIRSSIANKHINRENDPQMKIYAKDLDMGR